MWKVDGRRRYERDVRTLMVFQRGDDRTRNQGVKWREGMVLKIDTRGVKIVESGVGRKLSMINPFQDILQTHF